MRLHEEISQLRTQLSAGPILHPGNILADRFRLIELAGDGGFADVWRAHDRHTETLVAVKILRGSTRSHGRLERFVSGARKMATLKHDAIVPIIEAVQEHNHIYFYVMPWFEGGNLREAIRDGNIGRLGALRVLANVIEALEYAHSDGVIHRDIKPSNILLDRFGSGWITDFDLARAEDSDLRTNVGAAMGTIRYGAPEQFEDASTADHRADIYSLALCIMFALRGSDPTKPETVLASQVDDLECDDGLKQALRGSIARERTHRTTDCATLLTALRHEIGRLRPSNSATTQGAAPSSTVMTPLASGDFLEEDFEAAQWRLIQKASKIEAKNPLRSVRTWLRAAAASSPENPQIRQHIESIYTAHEKWPKLIGLYQKDLARAEHDDVRIDIYWSIVRVYTNHYRLPSKILDTLTILERLVEGRADNRMLLELLEAKRQQYEQTKSWSQLIDCIRRQANIHTNMNSRVELNLRAAQLAQTRTNETKEAIASLEAVLSDDPINAEALYGLKGIYKDVGDWERNVDIQRRELARISDGQERRKRLIEIARTSEREIADRSVAIAVWNDLLREAPDNAKARERLAELYLEVGDLDALYSFFEKQRSWAELARALEDEVKTTQDSSRRAALSLKASKIYERELADEQSAVAILEFGLDLDRFHLGLANALLTLYEKLEKTDQLSWPLRVRLDHEHSVEQRAAILSELATLAEQVTGDLEAAFNYWRQILTEDHTRVDVIENMGRLAREASTDLWAELVEALEIVRERASFDADLNFEFDVDVDFDGIDLNILIAEVREQHLGDPLGARFICQIILDDFEPDHGRALRCLDRIYSAGGSYDELVEIIERRINAEVLEGDEFVDACLRLAAILETECKDPDRAIVAYTRVLDMESENITALEHLEHLYASHFRFQELYDNYQKMFDVFTTPQELAGVYLRMGKIAAETLDREVDARRLWIEAADLDTRDVVALDELARLYERSERYSEADLSDVLLELWLRALKYIGVGSVSTDRATLDNVFATDAERGARMLAMIAEQTDGLVRVTALEERVRLLLGPLDRVEEAMAALEVVTTDDPSRAESASTLAELYGQHRRWRPLVALYERVHPELYGLPRVLNLKCMATALCAHLGEYAQARRAILEGLEILSSLAFETINLQLDQHRALLSQLADLGVLLPEGEHAAGDGLARWVKVSLIDHLHLQLVDCLRKEGNYADLASHLEAELRYELDGSDDPRNRYPEMCAAQNPRLGLMTLLARVRRDLTNDGAGAMAVYARLHQLGSLANDDLRELTRFYRNERRGEKLAPILIARSCELARLGDSTRKAKVDFYIGELLWRVSRRPREAAHFYLDAYLADPRANRLAGVRARVLLSGTDSVHNIRGCLLARLSDLSHAHQPALLILLADLLSPHDDYEEEAKQRYLEALHLDAESGGASEGLGRLLLRQGHLVEAVEPLSNAARSPDIPDERAADNAAVAARALVKLGCGAEAEAILLTALVERAPESQPALLELAKIYNLLGRKLDESKILERLIALPLSSTLRAEVGYRQAMLLADEFRAAPMSEAGDEARDLLIQAVSADATHAQTRQTLLELASARQEWSIVAHMHFLATRELPPGSRCALVHLALAQIYLERLADSRRGVRNLSAALEQAPEDPAVIDQASALAADLPDPSEAAGRLESRARDMAELLEDTGRARLLLVASELHLRAGALESAKAAVLEAAKLEDLGKLREVVNRTLEQLARIDQRELELRNRRTSLLRELAQTEEPIERLELLSSVRETTLELDDGEGLEELTRQLLECAHALIDDDGDDPATIAAIETVRGVFTASDDRTKIVPLYEELADRAGEVSEAATLLTSAARIAWLRVHDPKLAVSILCRGLDREPTHAPAIELLGEIAETTDDSEVDATICDELSLLDSRQRPPLLSLHFAEVALRLESLELAEAVLRQQLAGDTTIEMRMHALKQLDGLLDAAGRPNARIPLLEERLELYRRFQPDHAADVALALASALRAVGKLSDACATCRTALLDKPTDQPLRKLYAKLLEQAEDWPALARALEQLANLTVESREQAHWLTRAAQVHLDHGDDRESVTAARRLLERARAVSTESIEPRVVLIPLLFARGDWEQVLHIGAELRLIDGDEHEALLYAAITEAFTRGKRTLARAIADRHERPVRQRLLWPLCARILHEIATDGPLPRLDAALSAAAALCGGTEILLDEFGAWAAGVPLEAGLALGLARLNEAFRRMELARHLYQLAAFMAPDGPVSVLTTRLPALSLPRDPIETEGWIPLEWRGALREVFIQLRDQLAGVRAHKGSARPPRTPKEHLAVRHADSIVDPWRSSLGVELAIAVTEAELPAGISLRNLSKPTIIVNEALVDTQEAERRFRLAYCAAALATGVAVLFDDEPLELSDVIDAFTTLTAASHQPSSDAARGLVVTLASRGVTAFRLDARLRSSLARELDHWHTASKELQQVIHRSCLLIATGLSGTVDGALTSIARDRGLITGVGRPGNPTVLETSDAAWLLRALGIYGPHT
nr:serine/threonine-protein kinase [Plesiocystis pacifica]